MKFEPDESGDTDLAELTGLDVRYAAVVWNPDAGECRLVLGGMGEYEAAGALRAALRGLERHNADTVTLPAELECDETDDDDDPEV